MQRCRSRSSVFSWRNLLALLGGSLLVGQGVEGLGCCDEKWFFDCSH